ncbi:MAG: hypothetical protein ACOY3P_21665 [Planctomycetota bacterium]
MQLVLKNGKVYATHRNEQDIARFYPDADEIVFFEGKAEPGDDDPRTAEQKALAYRERRRLAYPPIGDQLDMIFWDKVNGTNVWVETIAEIKNRFRP